MSQRSEEPGTEGSHAMNGLSLTTEGQAASSEQQVRLAQMASAPTTVSRVAPPGSVPAPVPPGLDAALASALFMNPHAAQAAAAAMAAAAAHHMAFQHQQQPPHGSVGHEAAAAPEHSPAPAHAVPTSKVESPSVPNFAPAPPPTNANSLAQQSPSTPQAAHYHPSPASLAHHLTPQQLALSAHAAAILASSGHPPPSASVLPQPATHHVSQEQQDQPSKSPVAASETTHVSAPSPAVGAAALVPVSAPAAAHQTESRAHHADAPVAFPCGHQETQKHQHPPQSQSPAAALGVQHQASLRGPASAQSPPPTHQQSSTAHLQTFQPPSAAAAAALQGFVSANPSIAAHTAAQAFAAAQQAAISNPSSSNGRPFAPLPATQTHSPVHAAPQHPTQPVVAPSTVATAQTSAAATTGNLKAAGAAAAAATPLLLQHMQNWKLEQLEAHVQLLREANQAIPQPVAVLLAEARRKEEKRTAKRVANRKSACTSRARKKALVEEMTRTNARLRRQALILSLLPDLVLAITVSGEITFCSAQVERVLKISSSDLLGANMSSILVPASRDPLRRLIEKLVSASDRATASNAEVVASSGGNKEGGEDDNRGNQSSGSADCSSERAAIVSDRGSDRSFPLSVVNVKSRHGDGSASADHVEASDRAGGSASVAVTSSLDRSSSSCGQSVARAESSGCQSNSGVENENANSENNEKSHSATRASQPAALSDESSSLSDTKNIQDSSDSLTRNVQWHKAKLQKHKAGLSGISHRDDVTGASVTANNADARLSSLLHLPNEESEGTSSLKKSAAKKSSGRNATLETMEEQSSSSSDSLLAGVEETKRRAVSSAAPRPNVSNGIENASEDSGYRESNDSVPSREDTTSEGSDTSSNSRNGMRTKPLAPTCNVCVIRADLTTLWCEVTSSIRTRYLNEELEDVPSVANPNAAPQASASAAAQSKDKQQKATPAEGSNNREKKSVLELLLCLRPIRDGVEKVGEELRFVPPASKSGSLAMEEENFHDEQSAAAFAESSSPVNATSTTSGTNQSSGINVPVKKRPPKKRPLPLSRPSGDENDMESTKKTRTEALSSALSPEHTTDTEKSVVESLMLMSHHTSG